MGGRSGDTAKGAMIGQAIDPLMGGTVGALAGRHKRERSAQGPATSTPAPSIQYPASLGPVNTGGGPSNPWGTAAPQWNAGAGGKSSPQAQGPASGGAEQPVASLSDVAQPMAQSAGAGGKPSPQAQGPASGGAAQPVTQPMAQSIAQPMTQQMRAPGKG